MRTRITALLTAALLAIGLIAAPAAAHDGAHDDWGPMGPHSHALLLNAMFVENPFGPMPPQIAVAWDRCIDLAAGQPLAKSNHHTGIHQGAAGAALRNNAGHSVVPYTCAEYADLIARLFPPSTDSPS